MSETIIKIKHLRKEFSNAVPLKDINIEIKKGEVISIIGPSGTGKSTLLRCINRLETPTSGEIWIGDTDVCNPKTDLNKVRQKLGMVFQSFNLFSHKTVIENVIMAPIDLLKMPPQQAYDEGMELLKLVGLDSKAMNYPDELSGGQKQRVAIARALAMKPEIILFDEPTSALDPTMVNEVLSVIYNLAKKGMTMMIVTHEMRFARVVSSRVIYLDEGIVYDDDKPSVIFENPQKEKTRNFIFRVKSWRCNVIPASFDFYNSCGSLGNFCARQFLSKKQTMALRLIFEELSLKKLRNAEYLLEISCGENGTEPKLTVDYGKNGINPFDFAARKEVDELNELILNKYLERIPADFDGKKVEFKINF